MSQVKKANAVLGMGMFANNGHPVHPALVHFPITFLSVGYVLDAIHGFAATSFAPKALTTLVLDHQSDLSRLAYLAHVLGILTALPAVVTGASELFGMWSNQGLVEEVRAGSDGRVVATGLNQKLRITLTHAGLNDVAVAVSTYAWWTRRNVQNNMPTGFSLFLSALTLPGLFYSAYLGGSLVYEHGVGVMRQGSGKQNKLRGEQEELKYVQGQTQIKERKDM